jgi:hypothetical protein
MYRVSSETRMMDAPATFLDRERSADEIGRDVLEGSLVLGRDAFSEDLGNRVPLQRPGSGRPSPSRSGSRSSSHRPDFPRTRRAAWSRRKKS